MLELSIFEVSAIYGGFCLTPYPIQGVEPSLTGSIIKPALPKSSWV